MNAFDRILITTKAEYITITEKGENEGERRINKRKNITTFVCNQKQKENLYIQITPSLNKAVIEFTGKILLDDYYKLISIETIDQCFLNINKMGYFNIDIEKVISDSDLMSCGYSGDADPPCPVMLTPHKDYGSESLND